MILAFFSGATYATVLWFAALHVAHTRSLILGKFPIPTIAGSGIAAAILVDFFARDVALLLSASLIGTIVCATVDARTGLIFDALSLTMTVVACILAASTGHFADGVLAASVIGGALLTLHLVTGRRAIGFGDVKLSTALALGYGLPLSLMAIGSAFILGAGYGAMLLTSGRAKRSDAVRFGPFIAGGAAVGLTVTMFGYRW